MDDERIGLGGMNTPIDEMLRLKSYYVSLLSRKDGFGSECTIGYINKIILGLNEDEKNQLIILVNCYKALDCSTERTKREDYIALIDCLKHMNRTSRYCVDQGYDLVLREDKKEEE